MINKLSFQTHCQASHNPLNNKHNQNQILSKAQHCFLNRVTDQRNDRLRKKQEKEITGLEIWSWARINKRGSWQFLEYAENTHLGRENGEWLGKHLEGVVPDGCFLFDWSSIFLIKYEDPIFIFFNIYRSLYGRRKIRSQVELCACLK